MCVAIVVNTANHSQAFNFFRGFSWQNCPKYINLFSNLFNFCVSIIRENVLKCLFNMFLQPLFVLLFISAGLVALPIISSRCNFTVATTLSAQITEGERLADTRSKRTTSHRSRHQRGFKQTSQSQFTDEPPGKLPTIGFIELMMFSWHFLFHLHTVYVYLQVMSHVPTCLLLCEHQCVLTHPDTDLMGTTQPAQISKHDSWLEMLFELRQQTGYRITIWNRFFKNSYTLFWVHGLSRSFHMKHRHASELLILLTTVVFSSMLKVQIWVHFQFIIIPIMLLLVPQ